MRELRHSVGSTPHGKEAPSGASSFFFFSSSETGEGTATFTSLPSSLDEQPPGCSETTWTERGSSWSDLILWLTEELPALEEAERRWRAECRELHEARLRFASRFGLLPHEYEDVFRVRFPGADEEELEERVNEELERIERAWRNLELRVRSRTQRAEEWLADKRKAIERCGRSATLVVRTCGAKVAIPHRCHSVLCPTCARLDLWSRIAAYLPDVKAKVESGLMARFLTLTVPQCVAAELPYRIRALKAAFRRFMDVRLGPRALRRWRKLFEEALEASGLDERQKARQRGLWENLSGK